MQSYFSVFKVVLGGRSAGKILLATILSFTFSIAVILCTFGLMDGFDFLLKSGLRQSSGDILITYRQGFFSPSDELRTKINSISPLAISRIIQTEAFAISQEMSKGVLVRGVEANDFSKATGLKLSLTAGQVAVGEELGKELKLRPGDFISLTFGRGHEGASFLPLIQTFQISSMVRHGIYQKDLRFIYLNREDLAQVLDLGDKINLIILSTEFSDQPLKSLEGIKQKEELLKSELSSDFKVKPFWDEYDFLIEAVKVEKFSISLILQLIVVVAIFNIVAFVIYIMEKKAQDFFFLRAVGLSLNILSRFWFLSLLFIWGFSCLGAYFLSLFFNWGLKNFSFLQIPGEVYVLSSLKLMLDFQDYVTVYGISLLWILSSALVGYVRLKRKPIIHGLRQEFY